MKVRKFISLLLFFFVVNLCIPPSEASVNHLCQVYFEHNSSSLTPEVILVINDHIRKIEKDLPEKIIISGYADRMGGSKHNLLLSKRRVGAVSNYMIQALKPKHYNIELKWYGEYDLPYPTQDDVAEPLNRCVKIIIPNTLN